MTKVFLAVGHGVKPDGRYDPGATDGVVTEQSAGDPVVAEAARLLEQAGLDVRSQAYKRGPAFEGTVTDANRWGADVLVEVHHDWVGAPRGCFGHWYVGSAAGRRLADAIFSRWADAGLPTRPSWHRERNLYVVRESAMPAVLWECDRIGSLEDPVGAGRLLALGVADYLNIELEQESDVAGIDEFTIRSIVREELVRAFGGRSYQADASRDRESLRNLALALDDRFDLGLEVQYVDGASGRITV